MDTMTDIRKHVYARMRAMPVVRAILDEALVGARLEEWTRAYVRYLSEVAGKYSPHSPRVMALAASRCMSTHPELARYLMHHAEEEQGHEQWAYDDLKAFGISVREFSAARAVPSCAAMIGYTYYVAGHLNPVGIFGWMYVLEAVGDDLGTAVADNIRSKLRIADKGVRFVAGHGVADHDHTRQIAVQIERHIRRPQDLADIENVATVVANLYVRMFQEIGFE
ncbi:iron-containing redox enzyme family protein [Mesorhizobium sp. M1300]|uniref:iron-containing redox enzyme family protein n=1 Tax=Mesorhizobium sp. M1300 TaxID=2957077 RepID=UPI00333B7254